MSGLTPNASCDHIRGIIHYRFDIEFDWDAPPYMVDRLDEVVTDSNQTMALIQYEEIRTQLIRQAVNNDDPGYYLSAEYRPFLFCPLCGQPLHITLSVNPGRHSKIY